MKNVFVFLAVLAVLLVAIACGGTTPSTLVPAPLPMTQTPLPATAIPSPTSVPAAPSPTPLPSQPPQRSVPGIVIVADILLRAGPSTVHEVRGHYAEGTPVTVLGKVAGEQWLLVSTPDNQIGWMFGEYLSLGDDLTDVPLVDATDSYQIVGQVVDSARAPIPGVNLAVVSQADSQLRIDAISRADGNFYAYVPRELGGTWDVEIVGVLCSSPIMDANCQMTGYIQLSDRTSVSLPQMKTLEFIYEIATTTISGMVQDAQGQPVAGIRVVAVRGDSATVFGTTDDAGHFTLPATTGIWNVYALKFDPRREGPNVQIEITDNSPVQGIVVLAPE